MAAFSRLFRIPSVCGTTLCAATERLFSGFVPLSNDCCRADHGKTKNGEAAAPEQVHLHTQVARGDVVRSPPSVSREDDAQDEKHHPYRNTQIHSEERVPRLILSEPRP